MKYQPYLTASLSALILSSSFAYAAPVNTIKPRKETYRLEVVSELTPEGVKLEAEYTAMLHALREELTKQIPSVDEAKKTALLGLLKAELVAAKEIAALDKALRNTRTSEDRYNSLVEQQRSAPSLVTKAEKLLQEAQALPDSDPNKAKAVSDREKGLNNAKRTVAKLPGEVAKAKEAFEKADAEEARLMKEAEIAQKAGAKAQADTWKALDAMELESLLGSNKLDAKLAKFIVLSEGKPHFLAQFAQQGPEKKKLIDDLLADTSLMLQMLGADGAYWGKYGQAMEIYQAIQAASPKAKEGIFQRLALATALAHAAPINQRITGDPKMAVTHIDPVKRYQSFEKAFLAGELDPAFKDLTTWELTMVVDSEDSDEVLAWGREMMRSYRPDLMERGYTQLRYSQIVDGEIQYLSQFVKEDKAELSFMQNILANGGICGRRAFFGRFILKAFGIPAVERPEPGHATLANWTPEGWITYLGGDWGGRARVLSHGSDTHFLGSAMAREDKKNFIKVKRAQWIGDLMGEPKVYGLQNPQQEPQFWYAVALAEQNRINSGKKRVPQWSMEKPTPLTPAPAAESAVTVNSAGVITIPAVATKIPADNIVTSGWGSMRAVNFVNSHGGGMQLNFSRYGSTQALEYTFDAPKAGKYELTSRMVGTRWDMSFLVTVNGTTPLELTIPFTTGLWGNSDAIVVELKEGANTMTLTRAEDMRKGVAIKDFTLTPVK